MTQKGCVSPVLSPAEQQGSCSCHFTRPCLHYPTCPIAEKGSEDKPSKRFHETGLNATCQMSLPQ